jgi:myo-inositol-1(or 4)-monophosphatase
MYDQNPWHKELEVASNIAREAGVIMRQYFDIDQEREWKDDGTPVTIADTAINRLVIERIVEAFPEDGVIGEEESNTEYGMGRKWFCDPIDGTKAYTWGVATAMFSLGLVVDGVPVVGVVYNPFIDMLYYASRDGGAYANDRQIHVAAVHLKEGTVAVTSNLDKLRSDNTFLHNLVAKGIRTASFSGAVCKCVLVASGRFAGYVEDMVGTYDISASQVIVEEAGGKITDLQGEPLSYLQPFRGAIVSNGLVHGELVAMLGEKSA